MNKPTRYSDQDLNEFQELIQKKLEKSQNEMVSLREQITEHDEKMGNDRSDIGDSTISQSEGELLRTMLHRVQKYHRELENAMARINNKSYGICSVSGELIDKRRLRAVPTTSKSVAVKLKAGKGSGMRHSIKRSGKKIIDKVLKPFRRTKKKSTPPPVDVTDTDTENEDWKPEEAEMNEADLKALREEFQSGAEESEEFPDPSLKGKDKKKA